MFARSVEISLIWYMKVRREGGGEVQRRGERRTFEAVDGGVRLPRFASRDGATF